jgi:hypothetical protein
MNLRAAFFLSGFLFSVLVACTGGPLSSGDCGENACGACQAGFVNSDRCEDGEWKCDCVPRNDGKQNAEVDSTQSSSDSAAPMSCEQKLSNLSFTGPCRPEDDTDR